MPTAAAHDGSPIRFEVEGEGPTLMLFVRPKAPRGPLGATTRRLAAAFRSELRDTHRLVFLDYPGAAKPTTLTPDAVIADLLAVADAVGAERFGWFGYSWGAVIGIQLAVASDRLDALVCGGFPPLHGPYDEMRRLSHHLAGKAERLPVLRRPAPARVRAGIQQFATYYDGLSGFDDVAAQSEITCPKLCFAGTEDHVRIGGETVASIGGLVQDHADELAVHGWEVHVIPGANHLRGMNPELFMPQVSPWLRGLTRR